LVSLLRENLAAILIIPSSWGSQLADYLLHQLGTSTHSMAMPKKISWQHPPLNSYKLNIDACFFPNGSGAADAILQNSNGQAVAGASWELNNILDDSSLQLVQALQRGLRLIEQIGCLSVIIELDSLQLVQAFNG
jgi:hypothetical protein